MRALRVPSVIPEPRNKYGASLALLYERFFARLAALNIRDDRGQARMALLRRKIVASKLRRCEKASSL